MNSIFKINEPIVGLAPMDGVSDSPFRFITKKYGDPDLMVTEFTNVMGMCIAGDKIFDVFHYDESQRPIIGQIYGKEPEYFYHASKIIMALGFDGVDINMGCPAKNVASSGAGAGLIRTPDLAREIISAVKEGINHWKESKQLTGLSERSQKAFNEILNLKMLELLKIDSKSQNLQNLEKEYMGLNNLLSNFYAEFTPKEIPVSVKTRIGFDKPITEQWIGNLDRETPSWITIHGRTLKQMYEGKADWNEIKKGVNSTRAPVLANGDIKTKDDFNEVLKITGARGALIGRASFGDPLIFSKIRDQEIKNIDIRDLIIEHTKKFIELYPDPKAFFKMRKYFGWYIKGFYGASVLRVKLMQVSTINELEDLLNNSIT